MNVRCMESGRKVSLLGHSLSPSTTSHVADEEVEKYERCELSDKLLTHCTVTTLCSATRHRDADREPSRFTRRSYGRHKFMHEDYRYEYNLSGPVILRKPTCTQQRPRHAGTDVLKR